MPTSEERIRALAEHVADLFQSGQTVGLGSGSTAEAVVRAIGARTRRESGFRITGVSTSLRTADLARAESIAVVDLDAVSAIDIGFDGADEIDPALNLVKGRGGALLYEKLVAEICTDYVVVSSDEKLVARLGTRLPLPVEAIAYGMNHTASRIRALGFAPELRMANGTPYRTDAGNVIFDCKPEADLDLVALADTLKKITGVVEHGIFAGLARRAIVSRSDGSVQTVQPRL